MSQTRFPQVLKLQFEHMIYRRNIVVRYSIYSELNFVM